MSSSSPAKAPRWPALWLALAGAVGFSGKAIIVKLAYRHGVDAATLLMYRMLFSAPLFLLLAWWAGRGKPALTRRDWGAVLGLGLTGYYLASYLDFLGLQYISASLERLILYLNPTLVLLLGLLLFKRRVRARQLVGLATGYAGVMVVFGHEASFSGSHAVLGTGLVFASAVSYAIYLVYSGEVVQRLGALRLTGLATSVACVLCIGQFLLLRPLDAAVVAPAVLGLSVLNATACTVAPVLLTMLAIERMGAVAVAQVGMVGPMSTLLLGALLLGEPITVWVALGTVLVLAGVWVVTRR